jgi:hypothetical protein
MTLPSGLYPCKDGSYKEDWRDCNGGDESEESDEESGCQGEDDYCDVDEGCESESVDCIDDVEDFGGGDSKETATGDREYDPGGNSICGNDETGEEWTC